MSVWWEEWNGKCDKIGRCYFEFRGPGLLLSLPKLPLWPWFNTRMPQASFIVSLTTLDHTFQNLTDNSLPVSPNSDSVSRFWLVFLPLQGMFPLTWSQDTPQVYGPCSDSDKVCLGPTYKHTGPSPFPQGVLGTQSWFWHDLLQVAFVSPPKGNWDA